MHILHGTHMQRILPLVLGNIENSHLGTEGNSGVNSAAKG